MSLKKIVPKAPKQTERKIIKTINGVQQTKSQHQAQNHGFSILRGPFVFDAAHEPELLQKADEEAIVTQNGLHFINSGLFSPDGKTGAALDNDFRDLVESVMNPISSKSGD